MPSTNRQWAYTSSRCVPCATYGLGNAASRLRASMPLAMNRADIHCFPLPTETLKGEKLDVSDWTAEAPHGGVTSDEEEDSDEESD